MGIPSTDMSLLNALRGEVVYVLLKTNQPFKCPLDLDLRGLCLGYRSHLDVQQKEECKEGQCHQDQCLEFHSHEVENHCCCYCFLL